MTGDHRDGSCDEPIGHEAKDHRVVELGRREFLGEGEQATANRHYLEADRQSEADTEGRKVEPALGVPVGVTVELAYADRCHRPEDGDDDRVVEDEGGEVPSIPTDWPLDDPHQDEKDHPEVNGKEEQSDLPGRPVPDG